MIDEKGFYRKTYDDILTDLNTVARQQFGEDINLEESSALGKFIRIVAYELDELWQDIEGAYYSGFISTATGVSLDRIATRVALSRLLENNATANVSFVGTANYTIPVGFIVATTSGVQFTTTSECTLDGSGEGTTEVMCIDSGSKGNVVENKITVIVNPSADVTSVNNSEAASNGREKETDVAFRERILESIGNTAGTTINGIAGALSKLSGVKSVAVIENATGEQDEDGRPAHSFEAYVQGGDNQKIAETIFDKKPIGIEPIGDITQSVTDVAGGTHTMKFSRPTAKNIYVKVRAVVDSTFDNNAVIKTAVIDYIGGTDADGTYYYGLEMGKNLILSKLLTSVSNLEGIKDTTVQLSTDNSTFVANNIFVSSYEIAQTDYEKITLEVVL